MIGSGLEKWESKTGDITLVAPFVFLEKPNLNNGSFINAYWRSLPKLLNNSNAHINWIQILTSHEFVREANSANTISTRLNELNKNSTHVFLETFLGVKPIISALRDYFLVTINSWWLGWKITKSQTEVVTAWSFFEREWFASQTGPQTLLNLLNLALFERALNGKNTQKACMFLMENQPWEKCLIYS